MTTQSERPRSCVKLRNNFARSATDFVCEADLEVVEPVTVHPRHRRNLIGALTRTELFAPDRGGLYTTDQLVREALPPPRTAGPASLVFASRCRFDSFGSWRTRSMGWTFQPLLSETLSICPLAKLDC
jgi:hypothetical protein